MGGGGGGTSYATPAPPQERRPGVEADGQMRPGNAKELERSPRLGTRVVRRDYQRAGDEAQCRGPADRPWVAAQLKVVGTERGGPRPAPDHHRPALVAAAERRHDHAVGQQGTDCPRPAAQQVDQVGLADGLGRRRIIGSLPRAQDLDLDFCAERSKVLVSELAAALRDLARVICARLRQEDSHPWPCPAGRGQQLPIDRLERRGEFA